MLKRVVYLGELVDKRYKVRYISDVLDIDEGDRCPGIDDKVTNILINHDYKIPNGIKGKRTQLYYNTMTDTIDVEYEDISFDELPPEQKIDTLQAENDDLRHELDLTQSALFEVVDILETLQRG